MTDIAPAIIKAILDDQRICISTELKWKCDSYGIYHDDTARVADSSNDILIEDLSTTTYPALQGKRIYKSKTNPPSEGDLQKKVRMYEQVVRAQHDLAKSGLFSQALITLAFWSSSVTSRPIVQRMNEDLIMSTRTVNHLQGTMPELDIYFAISRGHYGTDVKNKLEMQTPESSSKKKLLKDIIAIWASNGIRPVIASPMSSKNLKRQLMLTNGRAFDYRYLLLLEDPATEQAFKDLGMTLVKFLPGINVDGIALNGREFFAQTNKILDKQVSMGELLGHISYSHPIFSYLVQKSEGLFCLFSLQNIMEMTVQHSSKSQAMRSGVNYLVYQYVCAATEPISPDTLTRHVRAQRYLSSTAPLSKLSISESSSVVSDSILQLEQIGLVSRTETGDILSNYGRRPEEFLRIERDKIRKDFGF